MYPLLAYVRALAKCLRGGALSYHYILPLPMAVFATNHLFAKLPTGDTYEGSLDRVLVRAIVEERL